MLRGLLADLIAFLRRGWHRSAGEVPATAGVGTGADLLVDVATGETAIADGLAGAATPEPCDDEDAALDLAQLETGSLSPEGVTRLATHLHRCQTCRIVASIIVIERVPAEGTGKHAMREEWLERIRR